MSDSQQDGEDKTLPANVPLPAREVSRSGARGRSSPAPHELPPRGMHPSEAELVERVSAREERKLRARSQRHRSVWFGLGMFGLVGWSVAVPTMAAIALGVWIDTRWPSQYSWTLMLLVVGVAIGCFNAWYWVTRERERA